MYCIIKWYWDYGDRYIDEILGPFLTEDLAHEYIDTRIPKSERLACDVYPMVQVDI